jgi:glycosyltransferase involved in cell wall biosynthesis
MARLLIATHEFPPVVGGAGSVAYQNARALARHHEVDVLTLARGTDGEEPAAYRVLTAGPPSKWWAVRFALALRRLSLDVYDAIVLNDVGATYAAGAALEARHLRKAFVYAHGSEPRTVLRTPSWPYRLTGIPRAYRRALRHCHRVVAVSRYQRTRYVEAASMPRLRDKAVVAYAGVDRSLVYPEAAPELRAHMAPAEETVLLSVSRIEANKGYPAMYRIFRRLARRDLSWRWVVVGSGSYLDTLRQQAERDGLDARIWFAGRQPRGRLRTFYTEADVFWLLSEREAESFGLVYIEANACGTPVIARRKAGAVEAVDDGVSGFLVEADEQACERLLRTRAFETLAPEALAAHAKRFGVERTAAALSDLMLGPLAASSASVSSASLTAETPPT